VKNIIVEVIIQHFNVRERKGVNSPRHPPPLSTAGSRENETKVGVFGCYYLHLASRMQLLLWTFLKHCFTRNLGFRIT